MSPLKTLACAVTVALTPAAMAATVVTVDGVEITDQMLERYAVLRTGEAATPQNRDLLVEALTDVVALSNAAKKQGIDKQEDMLIELEIQRFSALANALVLAHVASNPVTDEQVRAEYDRQIVNVSGETQFKARHILVEQEEEAKAIIASLDQGADFAELAIEKSTGPSGPQGGDLGWFSPNTMVAPFSAAVAALEDGKYSKTPVQTDFGWHVILREESRTTEPPSFDDVKDRLRQSMEQQVIQQFVTKTREASTRVQPE